MGVHSLTKYLKTITEDGVIQNMNVIIDALSLLYWVHNQNQYILGNYKQSYYVLKSLIDCLLNHNNTVVVIIDGSALASKNITLNERFKSKVKTVNKLYEWGKTGVNYPLKMSQPPPLLIRTMIKAFRDNKIEVIGSSGEADGMIPWYTTVANEKEYIMLSDDSDLVVSNTQRNMGFINTMRLSEEGVMISIVNKEKMMSLLSITNPYHLQVVALIMGNDVVKHSSRSVTSSPGIHSIVSNVINRYIDKGNDFESICECYVAITGCGELSEDAKHDIRNVFLQYNGEFAKPDTTLWSRCIGTRYARQIQDLDQSKYAFYKFNENFTPIRESQYLLLNLESFNENDVEVKSNDNVIRMIQNTRFHSPTDVHNLVITYLKMQMLIDDTSEAILNDMHYSIKNNIHKKIVLKFPIVQTYIDLPFLYQQCIIHLIETFEMKTERAFNHVRYSSLFDEQTYWTSYHSYFS